MCEPTTIAMASLAMTALGGGVSAYGQVQQGKAAEGQANYQAAVGRNNAIIAERQARDSEERGAADELAQRRQTAAVLGKQRAGMAANGVDLSSGSPLDILGDTAAFGELDALTVRSNAAREAYGFRAQGSQFTSDAAAQQIAGRNTRKASYIGAGSTLLTSASQAGGNWATFKNGGISRSIY
jgi:hypothetical protein